MTNPRSEPDHPPEPSGAAQPRRPARNLKARNLKARNLKGWDDFADAVLEHRELNEEQPWHLIEGRNGRFYNVDLTELQETSVKLVYGLPFFVALTVIGIIAMVTQGVSVATVVVTSLAGSIATLSGWALRSAHRQRALNRQQGLPRVKRRITLPEETAKERASRHARAEQDEKEAPTADEPTTFPLLPGSDDRPAANTPWEGDEPTNAELAATQWPRLPQPEERPDESWWERHHGYGRFKRMHDKGHDDLLAGIAENQRLTATSDHAWVLAQDDAGRWYNYRSNEVSWLDINPKLSLYARMLCCVGTFLSATFMGSTVTSAVTSPVALVVVLLITAAVWIPVGHQIRAARARRRREVPRPVSPPYPVNASTTGR